MLLIYIKIKFLKKMMRKIMIIIIMMNHQFKLIKIIIKKLEQDKLKMTKCRLYMVKLINKMNNHH